MACKSSTGSEEEEPVTEISKEQAIETLVNFLEDLELAPASASSKEVTIKDVSTVVTDYISWDENDSGTPVLKLWIGPEGHIIPSPDWQEANKDACKSEYRYMKGGVKLLNIKIHSSTQEVTVQYIDVETSTIEKQQMGRGNGQSWLYDALVEAWDKFENLNVKPAEGPCGENIRLRMKFTSEITAESQDSYIFDHVQGDFLLKLSDDESSYEGESPLEWIGFVVTSPNGSLPECSMPGGNIAVYSFTLPNMDGASADHIEMEMGFEELTPPVCSSENIPLVNTFDLGWHALHWEQEANFPEPDEYLIQNWEDIMDFSGVIARKVYDRTKTLAGDDGASATYTEKTTFEIIHDPNQE